MSVEAPPRATIPARKVAPAWNVGDVVQIDGTRWIIRALNRKTGRVALASSNRMPSPVWWSTTTDKLPRKAAS